MLKVIKKAKWVLFLFVFIFFWVACEEPIYVTVTIASNGNGLGKVVVDPPLPEDGKVLAGSKLTFTAIADEKSQFRFFEMTLGNYHYKIDSDDTFTEKIDGDLSLSAYFESVDQTPNTQFYTVSVSFNYDLKYLKCCYDGKEYNSNVKVKEGDSVTFFAYTRDYEHKIVSKWVGGSGESYWDYERNAEALHVTNISSDLSVDVTLEEQEYFQAGGIAYRVMVKDKEVTVSSSTSASSYNNFNYPPLLSIPASVSHNQIVYKVTGVDSSLKGDIKQIHVDPANERLSSEEGVLFDKEKKRLWLYPRKKTSSFYHIPESVIKIKEKAFASVPPELKTISFPRELEIIEKDNFSDSQLKSIQIPQKVKELSNCFRNCKELVTVEWYGSMEEISGCFNGCDKLKTIICHSVEPFFWKAYGDIAFDKIDLIVPRESIDSYKDFFFWSQFKTIQPIE